MITTNELRNFEQDAGMWCYLQLLCGPQTFVVASRNSSLSRLALSSIKHWLHSSQTSLLRNKAEGNLSDSTSSSSRYCWACGKEEVKNGIIRALQPCSQFTLEKLGVHRQGLRWRVGICVLRLQGPFGSLTCAGLQQWASLVCRSREHTNTKEIKILVLDNWGLYSL